jgi:hypothetical protein
MTILTILGGVFGEIPGPISGERIMKQLSADATIDVGKAVNRNILAATTL